MDEVPYRVTWPRGDTLVLYVGVCLRGHLSQRYSNLVSLWDLRYGSKKVFLFMILVSSVLVRLESVRENIVITFFLEWQFLRGGIRSKYKVKGL